MSAPHSYLPDIEYYPDPPRTQAYAAPLPQPPGLVVIHDTGNDATAHQEAHYAAHRTDPRSNWTSSHFYVDTAGPLGSLPLDLQAWAAYDYANAHGWHIEMCGFNTGQPGAVPQTTIDHAAKLARTLADRAGIPLVKLTPDQVAAGARGICGHYDITVGLHVGDHTDPGPAFNWAGFMATVKGEPVGTTLDSTFDADGFPGTSGQDRTYAGADKNMFEGFFGDPSWLPDYPDSVPMMLRRLLDGTGGPVNFAPVLEAIAALDAKVTRIEAALRSAAVATVTEIDA